MSGTIYYRILVELFNGEVVELTKLVKSFNITKQISLKNNGFSINLKNPYRFWKKQGQSWVVFQSEGLDVGNRIFFYLSNQPISDSDNPVFVGLTKGVDVAGKNSEELKISGVDYNLRGLSKLWSQAFYNKTASDIVKALMNRAFNGHIDLSNVQNTTQTLDVFSLRYEPLYQVIQRLGSPQNTGLTNQMIFYLLPNHNNPDKPLFYWFEPSQTFNKTFNSFDYEVVSVDGSRNTEGAVNHVIFYAGEDKNGVGITDHVFDPTIVGGRSKSVWENYAFISKELKKKFQDQGTYDNMSNGDFRNACVELGKVYARNLINGLGNPRYDLKLILKNTLDFEVGDLVRVTDYETNLNNPLLRIVKLSYSLSSNQGFRCGLEFKQDNLALSKNYG